MQGIAPFLWFDDGAEETMNFYASIFKNSNTQSTARYGEEGAEARGRRLVEMRRWLNIVVALTILTLTLFSFGCAGTSSFTECEGPAFSANSNCMSNPRYFERFGY